MERHKITAEQAFTLLMRVSQQRNTKLPDLAERLVHSGVLAERRVGRATSGTPAAPPPPCTSAGT